MSQIFSFVASGGGGISNVVEDTTPQLGGDLDVNSNSIVSVSAGDIAITPDTTGDIVLDGLKWPQADGTANFVLETDGLGQLGWAANTGGLSNVVEDTTPQLGGMLDVNGNSIGDGTLELLKFVETVSAVNEVTVTNAATGNGPTITSTGDDAAVDLALTPKSTGDLLLDGLKWPQADGSADQVLKTDGLGQLSWTANAGTGLANVVDDTTPQLGGSLDVNGQSIVSVTAGNITITPDTTGDIVLDGLNWPQADGTADQVLKTDGLGQLSWTTAGTGTVTASSTDTFTNKTIDANGTGNSISNIDVADLANGTDGELITWDAAGVPATVAVGTATHVLTSNGVGAAPTFQAAAGGGAMPDKDPFFGAGALQVPETNFAPLEKLAGINVNVMVRAFDDTTEEYANGQFLVPADVESGSTITFRAIVTAKTAAASKNVALTFGHLALANGEDWDLITPYTEEDSGDKAINATQDLLTVITWTETLANLGWAASDLVLFRLSRDPAATNDLTGDMYLFGFGIEMPRA